MEKSQLEEDFSDDENQDFFINFPPDVQKAIEEVNECNIKKKSI